MGNDFHRGPWLIDKRLSIGAGFTVRPRDQKNPASFRTFNDADGEFARRIVRALDQADVAPELLEALKRAEHLVRLLTVEQVMQAGNAAVDASGLHPFALNEGRADKGDRLSTYWLSAAIAKAEDNG